MFKNTIYLFAAILITMASCQKNATKVETNVEPVPAEDTSYRVSGVSDITLMNIDEQMVEISVKDNDGVQKKVSLRISGLPESITAKFSSEGGFTPFTSTLSFETEFAPAGIYPLVVTAVSNEGITKTFNINLTVENIGVAKCISLFLDAASLFPTTYDSVGNSINNNTRIEKNFSTGVIGMISVVLANGDDFSNTYFSNRTSSIPERVKLDINCDNGTLIIPQQKVEGVRLSPRDTVLFNVSGQGTMDIATQTYNITYTTDSGSYKLLGSFTTE